MTYAQNSRTLIATFPDYGTAQRAARELESKGVSPDAVHVDASRTSGAETRKTEDEKETGFMGWWNSLFGSDDGDDTDRRSYQGALEKGSTILRATVPAEAADASVDVLNRYGAVDVDELSGPEARTANTSDATAERSTQGGPIQVVEEELQVGKRAVRRGGVRIYSHVVSEPVEQQVRLREEHVNVERRPVNRDISPDEVSALRDQTIEVTETAEEAVIAKRARVREEVVVGKESTDRTETVRDNVRHTELEIEQLGDETGGSTRAGEAERTTSGSSGVRATGLSPNKPSPLVMSGGASTAGAGTLAGESTSGWSTHDITSDYRRNFESNYKAAGADFDTMLPAYEYGSRFAGDSRYTGKSWDQVESDLRSGYERDNPGSTWDQVKGAVRHGWEKVTGQR